MFQGVKAFFDSRYIGNGSNYPVYRILLAKLKGWDSLMVVLESRHGNRDCFVDSLLAITGR